MEKRIIPCLDIDRGRVVKGVHFLNLKETGDPVELARTYDQAGADELVMLNISGSRDYLPGFMEIIQQTAKEISIPLIAGGGLNNLKEMGLLLQAGASKVSLNTAAVRYPELIKDAADSFGSSSVTVAVDGKKSQEGFWEVCIQGGRKATGRSVLEWVKKVEELGAGEILLTSMDRDGTQDGYDLELTRRVKETVKIPVIASGGAGKMEHLYEALIRGKADAVLAASIFHFGRISIEEAKNYLAEKGVKVRR
ncbi:MAG TPA: imidazole glycerol phosphate synthase subunit HisF [Clostridia bacterium]|nr:imidazole glycerol phosphate synthase subunit HisF [Clostridia bacterium]